MTKRPSYLKGLIDNHARAKAALDEQTRIKAMLEKKVEELKHYEQALQKSNQQVERISSMLFSTETLIKAFDSRLDMDQIQATRAWQGRYGKRGSFYVMVFEQIERAGAAGLNRRDLYYLFYHYSAFEVSGLSREQWGSNRLDSALKRLVRYGKIRAVSAEGALLRWVAIDSTFSFQNSVWAQLRE